MTPENAGNGKPMKILVVCASKYGSTQEIGAFITEKLRKRGLEAETRNVETVPNPADYDALVVGSAVYMGHWMDVATDFVRRSRSVLANRPVWLFSSGPLGLGQGITSVDDPKLEPKEIAELKEAIHPRGHQVFFGALDPGRLGFKHRALRKLPAARAMLPEGDFRNWSDIEAWANGIAEALRSPCSCGSAGR